MAHLKNERHVQQDLDPLRRWSAVGDRPERVRNAVCHLSGQEKRSGSCRLKCRAVSPRQVRERDKRIAELESQLDALKVIDQDMEQRRKSSRSPATLTPATTGPFPYPTFRVLPRYQELDVRIHAWANGRGTPCVMPDTRAAFTPEICLSDFIQGDGRNPILLGAVSYEPIGGQLQLKGMIARRGACVGSPTLVRRRHGHPSSTSAWDVSGDGLNLES